MGGFAPRQLCGFSLSSLVAAAPDRPEERNDERAGQ